MAVYRSTCEVIFFLSLTLALAAKAAFYAFCESSNVYEYTKEMGKRCTILFLISCRDTLLCNLLFSNKEGKDQESIQSSTTPDPGYQWESNKLTIRHHNESQEVNSTFFSTCSCCISTTGD